MKNKIKINIVSLVSIVIAAMLAAELIWTALTKSSVTFFSFICVNIIAILQAALIIVEESRIKYLLEDMGGADAEGR